MVDVLVSGVPALLVPFQGDGSETEQPMRGRRLKEIGRVEIIDEDELNPEGLAQAVARLAGPEPWRLRPWACDGARISAELIAGWAREGSGLTVRSRCGCVPLQEGHRGAYSSWGSVVV